MSDIDFNSTYLVTSLQCLLRLLYSRISGYKLGPSQNIRAFSLLQFALGRDIFPLPAYPFIAKELTGGHTQLTYFYLIFRSRQINGGPHLIGEVAWQVSYYPGKMQIDN